MEHEPDLWIEFAEKDLSVAKHLYHYFVPMPMEIICYHCQQAAEKAIKALMIALGIPGGVPKKHNLSFLLEQMKNNVNIPEQYYDYTDVLTPYAITVKYPNELFLEEHHVEEAIEYAERIFEWVKEVLG